MHQKAKIIQPVLFTTKVGGQPPRGKLRSVANANADRQWISRAIGRLCSVYCRRMMYSCTVLCMYVLVPPCTYSTSFDSLQVPSNHQTSNIKAIHHRRTTLKIQAKSTSDL